VQRLPISGSEEVVERIHKTIIVPGYRELRRVEREDAWICLTAFEKTRPLSEITVNALRMSNLTVFFFVTLLHPVHL
jgi:hypothetical protein